MPELLLEIGLEEIPARMIAAAEAELAHRVNNLLTRARLAQPDSTTRSYSTPRRLAVHITGIAAAQADTEEQLTGPAWNIAFKNGAPTPAAQAFAKKAGVLVEALVPLTTPKGEYASATAHRPGRTAAEVLSADLPKEIAALTWPKNMYWRPAKPERYIRPVKWLLALLDHAILPLEFAGVHSANLTYGHRILHGPHALTIEHPGDYLAALENAKVLADVAARRHKIRKALDHVTRTVTNARWREDEPLIETVTHLTEWPSVILGTFEAEYLTLPEEVLVTVMRDHQKYFAVEDESAKLAPYFLAVLNTEADPAGVIRHGNERVLRARFNDARFFWNFDQKIPLTLRLELLKSVTFHKDLGTYYEKTQRTEAIALNLAQLASQRGVQVDIAALRTAAQLAKADLTSDLVKEFTELQGIVGGLYARAQGLSEEVAQAIYWQYQPASMADPIPPTMEGQLLGLAERIGTIVDMFAKGFEPTGSKDPYALRRAGNGIIKILADSSLPLGLRDLELEAIGVTQRVVKLPKSQVGDFLIERLAFYLSEICGMSHDVARAVLATSVAKANNASGFYVADAIARAEAVTAVRGSDDFAAIASAFKRSKNILRQATEKLDLVVSVKDFYHSPVENDPHYLQEPAELDLYAAAMELSRTVEMFRRNRQYGHALAKVAELRPHVDRFFDQVMVMVDDVDLRKNRLALVALILEEFSKIADFSEIVTAGARDEVTAV